MEPVFVLFWGVVLLYASFGAGWAMKWERSAAWTVLSTIGALVSGWLCAIGAGSGILPLYLVLAATGLYWGAYHWRSIVWAGLGPSRDDVRIYSWEWTLNRWGFPNDREMVRTASQKTHA